MSAAEYLDQLDKLRAAGTKGPWHTAASGAIDAGDYDTVIGRGPVDCMSYCYGGSSTIEGDNLPADAALIVAAVNALPQLTSALRNAANVLTEHYRVGTGLSHNSPDECSCGAKTRPLQGDNDISERRARAFAEHQAEVLTAPLSPVAPQSAAQP